MKKTTRQKLKNIASAVLLFATALSGKAQSCGTCTVSATGCELIANGSFEYCSATPPYAAYTSGTYPYYYPTIQMACGWDNPTGGSSTPDYFTAASPVSATPFLSVNVPNNYQGTLTAHTGNDYAGVYAYDGSSPGYHEYIYQTFACPLVKGVTYQVSFWVSLSGNSTYYTDHLGAAFIDNGILSANTGNTQVFTDLTGVSPLVPQVLASPVSTQGSWTHITGSFVSDGTEQYIVIGDFGTSSYPVGSPMIGRAYYYIDDVSVQPLNNLSVSASPNPICVGMSTTLHNNLDPSLPLAWSPSTGLSCNNCGQPTTPSLSTNTSYTATLAFCGGCTYTAATTVTVSSVPVLNRIPNFTYCNGASVAPYTFVSTPAASFAWSNSNTSIGLAASGTGGLPTFTATNTGSSPTTAVITVTPTGACAGTAASFTITVNPNQVTTSPSSAVILMGSTSSMSASGASTYTWSPAGTLTNANIYNPVASPSVTTTYTVTGTNSYGCISSATAVVTVTYTQCGLTTNTMILSNTTSSVVFSGSTHVSNLNIYVGSSVTFTIDNNITFSGCNFSMEPGSKIYVQGNQFLTFDHKTHLYACDDMWDGIYLPANARLIASGSTFIEDAMNAVVSQGGGSFNLKEVIFNRNYKAIDVQSYSGVPTFTVANTIFTSRFIPSFVSSGNSSNYDVASIMLGPITGFASANMKSPNSSLKSPYAINTTDVSSITIGAVATGSTNVFDNVGCGINLTRTNATIYNNRFQNMINATSILGKGIVATGAPTASYSVTIGGSSANQPNIFSDVYSSAEITDYLLTSAISNTVTNTNTLSGGTTGYGKYGFYISPATANTIDVEGNNLTNCANGIYMNRSSNGINSVSTLVSNNIIKANAGGYCTYGVYISDVTNSGSTTPADKIKISSNTITGATNCVFAFNVKNSLVIYNNPALYVRNDGVTAGTGIRLQNCKFARVYNNSDISLVPAYSPVTSTNIIYKGIYVISSPSSEITCNTINNMGESMVFVTSSASSTISNNKLNGGNRGFVLRTNGETGTQGSTSLPCGLWWSNGSTFTYHTYTDNTTSANTNSILYTNTTGVPPGYIATPTLNGGSGLASTYYTTGLLTATSGSPIDCSTIVVNRLANRDNTENITGVTDTFEFVVYPNPNNGSMTLNYQLEENANAVFSLYDVTGRLVVEQLLTTGSNTQIINHESLQQGIYYYSVLMDKKIVKTDKLVIIK
ncbi:MAG: T9SS type A sorting domain-containing protein [Bacteroidota bacterium]